MANLKCDKRISLMNIVRTTTSSTYTFTEDRNPLFLYTAADYSNATAIYFSGVLRAASGDTAFLILADTGGSTVASSEISTTSTTNVVVQSGDITADIADGTTYRAQWKRTGAGTASFDRATFVVKQDGAVTATAEVIEIGEDNNVTTSYAAPTDHYIFQFDSARFTGTVTVYFEADLHCNSGANTTSAQLYDITAGAAVSSSEVTHTGNTTTTRVRSGAITLVDGHEYRADVKGTSTSDDVNATKIIIKQSGSPTKTDCYSIILNTLTSGTGSGYTYQNRLFTFDASDWSGDSEVFLYEATLKSSSGNTAYYNLYNDTDAAQIAEVTTTDTNYDRVRSSGLTMPVDDGNTLNSGRKIDTSGTVSVARSFLIVQMDWSAVAARRVFVIS